MSSPHRTFRRLLACSVLSLIAGTAGLAPAAQAQQAVADFYTGKQMVFIIRSAPGGGYDLFSRLIGTHIVRHIPGKPTIIHQNMPGAGGIIAANFVAELAPKDGTHLTMLSQALVMDKSLDLSPQFKADVRAFGWIGNLGDSNILTYTWHTSPTKTMEQAKTRETTIGATGAGSATSWLPVIYNRLLGTKFKLVQGYKSGSDVKLAMERGEVEGYAANPWAALNAANPELMKEKKLNLLTQVGVAKERDLPHVPLLSELAPNPEAKAILTFISEAMSVGRPVATTPGVPPERLDALRKAFQDMLADPLFLDAAKKAGAELKPIDGITLEKLVNSVMGLPADIRAKAKAVMPERTD